MLRDSDMAMYRANSQGTGFATFAPTTQGHTSETPTCLTPT